MEDISNWTYDDFLTYLLICGAEADLRITEDEQDRIIQKFGEEKFRQVKKEFDKHNDAQHIDLLSRLYEKYKSTIGGKENLVREITEIVRFDDGRQHIMDRYLLMMLRKIL